MSKGRALRRLGAIAVAAVAAAVAGSGGAGAATAADGAIEKKAVMRTGDFPAGWQKSLRRSPTTSALAECTGVGAVDADLLPGSARSPRFVRPDAAHVAAHNAVLVLRSAKQARGRLAPYRAPDALGCIRAIAETGLGDDAPPVGVYVTPTVDPPPGADEAAGFDVEITVITPAVADGPAETTVIVQRLLVVRVGRALASFGFLNPRKPLPESSELVDVVVGRLQDALGR